MGKVSYNVTAKLDVMLVGVSVESNRLCATADVTKACHVVISDFLDVRTVKTIV